jgi:hypothetical protein
MSLRRLISVWSVLVVASAGLASAQPAAPAGDAPPPDGAPVQPIEDEPPPDMDGKDEDPDAPRGTGPRVDPVAPEPTKPTGFPIEEALRPITLPENLLEIGVGMNAQVSPYAGTGALRLRYGITSKLQLGLTYVMGGIYDDPATVADKISFHPGKAGGLDVTVLLQNWLGVRVGLPLYLDPFAMSLSLGAPMRFYFDKFTLGGMDEVLNIALPFGAKFAPSFYQELVNAVAADRHGSGSTQSRGTLRFSGYGIYQQSRQLAIIGRLALELDDFSANKNVRGYGGITTAIRAGVQYTVKRYLDVGGSLGFDDLARVGSFGPAAYVQLRI